MAVEPYDGFPVHTVKVKIHMLAGCQPSTPDNSAVVEIGHKEALGDLPHVVGDTVVGYGANVTIAGQHRSRHSGWYPTAISLTPQLPVDNVGRSVYTLSRHDPSTPPHLHFGEHEWLAVARIVHHHPDIATPSLAL